MALKIPPKVDNHGTTTNGRLTATEFNALVEQVHLNTPKLIESEEEYERMVAAGEIVEGQIYYIAEE